MSDSQRTLHTFYLDSARRRPHETALVVGERRATYAQLARMSDMIAGLLRKDSPPPRRVGLLASRSLVAYAGYLGILGAGATVVPLSPSLPPERLRRIADAAGLDRVIADEGAPVSALRSEPLPIEDAVLTRHAHDTREDTSWAEAEGTAGIESTAYVLFTSGSTGRPKGVPIRNANLDAFLRYHIARYGVGPGCRLSQTFDLAFDPSVFDMFVAWGGGATLVVPEATDLYEPAAFVNLHGITHWYSVPSVIAMAQNLGTLDAGSMPGLRWSLFAGERLTLDQAAAWAEAAPGSRVENLYGPTELSVTVTAYRLPARREDWPKTSNGSVPIGDVLPHLEYRLIAEDGSDDPQEGELCVRGPQRFHGYLDSRDNEGVFLSDTGNEAGPGTAVDATHWYRTGDRVRWEEGNLVHLGRVDLQVKVRGQRVELREIEAAVEASPDVAETVVLVSGDDGAEPMLHAVYTGTVVGEQLLRDRLRATLPDSMVPTTFTHTSELPRNANGKLDRAACETRYGVRFPRAGEER